MPSLFPQELSHKLHIVEFLVDVDLLRDIVAVGIVAQQEIPPHFPWVVLVADEEIFLVDQPSAAVLHRRDTRKADVLRERNYVVPKDVQSVFFDVCAHRLILRPQAQVDGITARDILAEILKQIKPGTER